MGGNRPQQPHHTRPSLTPFPLALLLPAGVLHFLLNYVPTAGPIIATLVPIPVVLLDPDLSTTAKIAAFAGPTGVHFLIGNFIEPLVFGSSMDLHPVTVLLALALWYALWGIPGAILAIPITAVIRIIMISIDHPYAAVVIAVLEGRLSAALEDVTVALETTAVELDAGDSESGAGGEHGYGGVYGAGAHHHGLHRVGGGGGGAGGGGGGGVDGTPQRSGHYVGQTLLSAVPSTISHHNHHNHRRGLGVAAMGSDDGDREDDDDGSGSGDVGTTAGVGAAAPASSYLSLSRPAGVMGGRGASAFAPGPGEEKEFAGGPDGHADGSLTDRPSAGGGGLGGLGGGGGAGRSAVSAPPTPVAAGIGLNQRAGGLTQR
jgi:hypothetical protein